MEYVASSLPLEIEHSILALEVLLEPRRAAFKKRTRVSIGLTEGLAFHIDTGAPRLIGRDWRDDADVSVITNRRTLGDLLEGRLDLAHPGPEHVLIWGGDADVWGVLAASLRGKSSAFAAHLARGSEP